MQKENTNSCKQNFSDVEQCTEEENKISTPEIVIVQIIIKILNVNMCLSTSFS